MSIWRRGPLDKNPYYRTAFRVARVPRDTLDRAMIVELVSQTRQLAEFSPEAVAIQGQPVSENELNQAEITLLDPKRRILEELLEHPVKLLGSDLHAPLNQDAKRLMAVEEASHLAPTNSQVFVSWILEECFPAGCSSSSTGCSFGGAELNLPPPWGGGGIR